LLHISASGPILVAQYSFTRESLPGNLLQESVVLLTVYPIHYISAVDKVDSAASDPMMAVVPPKEQYGNYYTFTTPKGVSADYR